MIKDIFDALSQEKLTVKEKLQNIEILFNYTINSYTADDEKVYLETYDTALNGYAIRNMSLMEVDDEVDKAAFGNDLMFDLLLLSNFAKNCWGASDSFVSLVNGDFILFEVSYGNETFKRIVDVEE